MLDSNGLGRVTWPFPAAVSAPEGCEVMTESTTAPATAGYPPLVPEDVIVFTRMLFFGIALPLCFLIAFPTNIINIIVFCKQGLKERVNMCLFTLAIMDLMYVTVAYGLNSGVPYMFAIGREQDTDPSSVFFFNNHLIGLVGFERASHIVSSVIALERCVCITHPLLVKNLLSTKKMAIMLWSVCLTVVGTIFVCTGWRFTVICIFDPRDNSTFYQYNPRPFYIQNKSIINLIDGTILNVTLPIVCSICIVACTIIIAAKMKKVALWRESVSSASDSLTSRDLAVTRMVVAVSVLFIATTVPSIIIHIAAGFIPGLNLAGRYESVYFILRRIFYLLSVMNSSFNFFVYYIYGSKFRKTFHRTFLPCCNKEESKNSEPTSSGY